MNTNKINYLHIRKVDPRYKEVKYFARGGFTVAFRVHHLVGDKGMFVQVAVARCSNKDNFNRKTGRDIANQLLEQGHYYLVAIQSLNTRAIIQNIIRFLVSRIDERTGRFV